MGVWLVFCPEERIDENLVLHPELERSHVNEVQEEHNKCDRLVELVRRQYQVMGALPGQ